MWSKLLIGVALFAFLHILVWFSANLQFVKGFDAQRTLFICVMLAVPISLSAYYASKFTYEALENSLWAVRFIGFGTSYLVFPILTWLLLGESMFSLKTLTCVGLSVLIVYIQVFW
jgi:hypothetical protein